MTPQQSMRISDGLLTEFDQEVATTRRVLERVPQDKFDWAPHEKSMKLGALAGHIAEMFTWGTLGLKQDSIDLSGEYKPLQPKSTAELVSVLDQKAAECRAAIAETSNETFMKNWSLLRGGQTLMTIPKIAVVRTFVMNHVIHHRGQLSVYLRLLSVPVPSIYGPSADEGRM